MILAIGIELLQAYPSLPLLRTPCHSPDRQNSISIFITITIYEARIWELYSSVIGCKNSILTLNFLKCFVDHSGEETIITAKPMKRCTSFLKKMCLGLHATEL